MNIKSVHTYDSILGKKSEQFTDNNNSKNPNYSYPSALTDMQTLKTETAPTFKGWEWLGKAKQWIDSKGFFVLFLIQDFFGMTFPRSLKGLNRDKEITGKYHWQEAKEVAGREVLTGPAMMIIPAGVFAITRKCLGKSTYTNTRLIKAFGKTLTNTLRNIGTQKVSADKLRVKYFEDALNKIYKETIGRELAPEKLNTAKDKLIKYSNIKFFRDEIKNIKSNGEKPRFTITDIKERFGSNYDKETLGKVLKDSSLTDQSELSGHRLNKVIKFVEKDLKENIGTDIKNTINDSLLSIKGADLSKLNKVTLSSDTYAVNDVPGAKVAVTRRVNDVPKTKVAVAQRVNDVPKTKVAVAQRVNYSNTYAVKDVSEALIRYVDDALINNKNVADITKEKAEEFMNSMIGRRFVSNLATIGAVLGIMNYLPKLYAPSDKPPGETSRETALANCRNQHHMPPHAAKDGDIAFTGGFSKIGKSVSKLKDGIFKEGEFHDFNFTNTLMAAISILGLTYPRATRAYNRAPEKDELTRKNEGWFGKLFKKDASEIKEIVVRDPISSLSVVYTVPLLTRGIIKSFEKSSGFVLINHPENEGKGIKKFLKYLNPYSNISVLGNNDLEALYGKIDTHEKMINVCEYLDRKGGDLGRIFKHSTHAKEVLNDSNFVFDSINKLKREEKNAKIISFIKNADEPKQKEILEKLLPTLQKFNKNKALAAAKTLCAFPFFASLIASAYILGWVIPGYTYKLTRKAHEPSHGMLKPKGVFPPPDGDKIPKEQTRTKSI